MFCPWRPGTAVSPAPLGAGVEILVAFGRRGRVMLLLYGLGATLVAVAAMTLSGTLPERGGAGRPIADVVDVGLGGCVLVMAADCVQRRPRHRKFARHGRTLGVWLSAALSPRIFCCVDSGEFDAVLDATDQPGYRPPSTIH